MERDREEQRDTNGERSRDIDEKGGQRKRKKGSPRSQPEKRYKEA